MRGMPITRLFIFYFFFSILEFFQENIIHCLGLGVVGESNALHMNVKMNANSPIPIGQHNWPPKLLLEKRIQYQKNVSLCFQ